MKKAAIVLAMALLGFGGSALAAVQLTGQNSLFNTFKFAPPSSTPQGFLEFSLSGNAGETLSSVSVIVQGTSTSTQASDIGTLSLYRDNGNGTFDPASDLVAGTQTSFSLGTVTAITATANNSLSASTTAPTKFFVAASTSASWSDAHPGDRFTVTLVANGIVTSANSPTAPQVVSGQLLADTTGPVLLSAIAKNTGNDAGKGPGDSIQFTFGESTNKPAIATASLASLFTISGGHTLLDSTGRMSSYSWNQQGTVLTITLSGTADGVAASGTMASIAAGDTVSVPSTTAITDTLGNKASGSVTVTGDFGKTTTDPLPTQSTCSNHLINGRLYIVRGHQYVYQASSCRLKLFKGKAYYKAQGNKFKDVIQLETFPTPGKTSMDRILFSSSVQSKAELEVLKEQRKAEIEAVREKYERQLEQIKKQIDDDNGTFQKENRQKAKGKK